MLTPVELTIITVCSQSAPLLERTIANVAAVKRKGIAYLVIDGGSTDGTLELLRRNDGVVDRWLSEPDSGIYDAMNKGWKLADPESMILFLGAGDKILSLPDNLKRGGDDEIVYGDVTVGERHFHSVADYRLKFSNTLHHQALMVPKRLHPEPPFNPAFPVYADYDFNLRLLKMGARFVRDPGLVGYAEPGGVSSARQHEENFMIVKNNFGVGAALFSAMFLAVRKLLECIGIRVLAP
jgi:glycosyltransferase involved in cell wall biosynthesis